jgi:transcription elongation factor Elf1
MPLIEEAPMSDEFTCPSCGRQSVVYPRAAEDDAAGVVCRTCGAFLGTLAQFRRLVERVAARAAAQTSRC